jgi:hypothetical protein
MRSEKTRGSLLRDDITSLAYHMPWDRPKQAVVELDPRFDIDLGNSERLNLPPNVLVCGKGPGYPTIRAGVAFSAGDKTDWGNCINLNHNSGFADCGLALNEAKGVEASLVGFDARFNTDTKRRVGFLRRCFITGSSWAVYVWPSGDANVELFLTDCDILSGRQCLSACGSNANSQHVVARRCRFLLDPSLVNAGGAISQGTFAVACRGGGTRLVSCEAWLGGDMTTTAKQVAFVSDGYAGQGEHATIEILDCHSRVRANGATLAADVITNKSKVVVYGGSGSGPGGDWILHQMEP